MCGAPTLRKADGAPVPGMKMGVNPDNERATEYLRTHDGLIHRRVALALGLSEAQIKRYVDKGSWQRIHRNVYRVTAAPRSDTQSLRAACMAAGDRAVASHRSAAWLWGLVDRTPPRPAITVPGSCRRRLAGVEIHRSGDLDTARTIVRTGIPVTDPLRTLVDLGSVLEDPELSDVLDRILARRLVTIGGMVAELDRLSRQGRRGPREIRRLMRERGAIGAPHPSVLESRMLRLLLDHDISVPAVELLAGPKGEYRLDFADPVIKLAIEVDGYVWHFTPEQLAQDHRRRNRLHADGWHTLVFTWMDVIQRPDEVAEAIRTTSRYLRSATA